MAFANEITHKNGRRRSGVACNRFAVRKQHTHAYSIHICRCYGSVFLSPFLSPTANSNPAAASHSGLTFCHLAQRLSKKQKQSGKKNKKDGNKIHDTITHTLTFTHILPQHTPSHTPLTHFLAHMKTRHEQRCLGLAARCATPPPSRLCLTSCYPRELYNKHENIICNVATEGGRAGEWELGLDCARD